MEHTILFKRTVGVIQSMEEQEAAFQTDPEEVVLPDLVAATVAVPQGTVDPDGQVQVPVEQATHQAVPRGPSCR